MDRLEVKGARVLVEVDDIEREKDLGNGLKLFIPVDEKQQRAAQQKGKVLQIGDLCWKDCTSPEPWCKVGERVLFTQYSGKFLPEGGEKKKSYYILNDLDIMAVILD